MVCDSSNDVHLGSRNPQAGEGVWEAGAPLAFHSQRSLANVGLPCLTLCSSDRTHWRASLTERQCSRRWIRDLGKKENGNVIILNPGNTFGLESSRV